MHRAIDCNLESEAAQTSATTAALAAAEGASRVHPAQISILRHWRFELAQTVLVLGEAFDPCVRIMFARNWMKQRVGAAVPQLSYSRRRTTSCHHVGLAISNKLL